MKYLFLFLGMPILMYAQVDSIVVNQAMRHGIYTYYLLNVADDKGSEILVGDLFIKWIFDNYEKKNYADYYSYLYDLMIRGKKIDPGIRKSITRLVYELRTTSISLKAKKGIEAVIKEYLKKDKQVFIIKKKLSRIQEYDLIRVMIKNGYTARRECVDGYTYFMDRTLLEKEYSLTGRSFLKKLKRTK